ncbi:MAG: hypothetical protein H0T42_31805 [Deltaproteobacteria bacterium]|nr:hypothetical protein [Deltaproteobacteria bacterium]
MMTTCDSVAERVALGEPLGELAEHAASCDRCRGVVALPAKLGATRHDIDPGLGFAARMTVGAQNRIAVRHRRRVATGLAASVAAGALAVFLFTRTSGHAPAPTPVATDTTQRPPDPVVEPTTDEDLAALIKLADVDRSSRLAADWSQIEKPLRPYRKLLQGVRP